MSFGVFTGAKSDIKIKNDGLAIFGFNSKTDLTFLVRNFQTNINKNAILFKELPRHCFLTQTPN